MEKEHGVEMGQVGDVRACCEQGKASEPDGPRIVVCPPSEETAAEAAAAPRGARLLRALARRLSRRDDDGGSTDSASSGDSDSSQSSSRRRPRSVISLRRVFQSLIISPRSLSSSVPERARPPKKNPQPQRILRSPVTHTYVRGLSGLPTQRVRYYRSPSAAPRRPAEHTQDRSASSNSRHL